MYSLIETQGVLLSHLSCKTFVIPIDVDRLNCQLTEKGIIKVLHTVIYNDATIVSKTRKVEFVVTSK